MRLFAYVALYANVGSGQKLKNQEKTIDLRLTPRTTKQPKLKNKNKSESDGKFNAPRPIIPRIKSGELDGMDEQTMMSHLMFRNGPPKTDFSQDFEAFALKNKFPPAVQEHKMIEEFAKMNAVRKKDEEKNDYLQSIRQKFNDKAISCLTCSAGSYDECYRTGTLQQCSNSDGACFLETRYNGHSVSHVSAGCQQKIACINNMKQNFWDLDGNGIKIEDEMMHECKLFSGGQGNSVCRNCCFENDCVRNWQPNSFDEWRILPKTPQAREMKLFDQFSNPPMHWMQAAEQRRIEYFTDLEEMNTPPKDFGKKKSKKSKGNETTTTTTTKRTTTTTKPPTTRAPRTTKAATLAIQRTMGKVPFPGQRGQFGARLGQPGARLSGPGNGDRPMGAQKLTKEQFQRVMQMREARMKAAQANQAKANEAAKIQATQRTTQRVVKTTKAPKPATTTKITDDDFMNLLNLLNSGKKEEKNPSNNQMRFSLNVNEKGEVNQLYGKSPAKSNNQMGQRLQAKPVAVGAAKAGAKVIPRAQVAKKQPQANAKFGPSTTKTPTTVKKGPWSHLPPWKQRQLKMARDRQLAAKAKAAQAKAAQGTARPAVTGKPTTMKQQKPMAQAKPAAPKQPLRRLSPMRRPGPGMRPGPAMVQAPKPEKSQSQKSKKSDKVKVAQPNAMRFSQWALPPAATLEEEPKEEVFEIQSNMNDDDFNAMIASFDMDETTSSKDIEEAVVEESQKSAKKEAKIARDPKYRLSDDEFDAFIAQLG